MNILRSDKSGYGFMLHHMSRYILVRPGQAWYGWHCSLFAMDGSGWMEPIQHVDDDGDDDEDEVIHDYDHGAYLIIVIFFTLTKLLENKIYT